MTERYDHREDRDNDIKTHDNDSHESHHSYGVHLEETDDQLENWGEEITEEE